jgi:hypothetical protein
MARVRVDTFPSARRDSSVFSKKGEFIMWQGNRSSNSSTPSNFTRAKSLIETFVKDYMDESDDRTTPLEEFEIKDACSERFPEIEHLSIRIFVEMLFHALIIVEAQFKYKRDGVRSFFYGIKIKGTSSVAMTPSDDEYPAEYGSTDFSPDEYQPLSSQKRVLSKDTTDDSASDDDDVSIGWVMEYIHNDTNGKLPVAKLRKLYNAIVTNERQTFNEFLDKFMENDGDLELVEEKLENGKVRRYIIGLALSDEGKSTLENIDV